MTEPDVHTLTGPYVLDALPDDERDRFEAHLAECTFCTTEVAELRAAAVKLATQVSTPPPPALKANVMSAIENVRQLPPVVHGQPPVRRRFNRRSVLALAAAAAVVAVSGGIAIDQYRDRTAAEQANQQVAAVLSQPDARTVHGAVQGGGQATVVVSAKADKSVVVLRDLPELPTNRTWQLWMIDRGQTAHSVGLAAGDLTRVIDGSTAGMTTFGLTLEPSGGSPKPTLPAAALIPLT
ncbi:anti-sigma-K factor RskA [Kribbella sp. VKM Ac-2569]|uniref:anti-sigma factor n=1 Tax=Kribbella sp. VKM Ac-2569 TaxID=2512220 RepID=UPI00102CE4FD|nr:anti-sigma factor [Kribbella sp. VKM Ac-2569]RZT27683.1 anti-sigma-K factor RskA [Kribbella sp. VKM Ac-2569]